MQVFGVDSEGTLMYKIIIIITVYQKALSLFFFVLAPFFVCFVIPHKAPLVVVSEAALRAGRRTPKERSMATVRVDFDDLLKGKTHL